MNHLRALDHTVRFIPKAKLALRLGTRGFSLLVTRCSVTALALFGVLAIDTWERWQK